MSSMPQKLCKGRLRVVEEEEEEEGDNSKRIRLASSDAGPSSFRPASPAARAGPSSFQAASPAARSTPRPSSNPGPSMAPTPRPTPRRIVELSGALDGPEAAVPQSLKTPTKETRLDVSMGTPDHEEEELLQEPSPAGAAAGKALELSLDDDWSLFIEKGNVQKIHKGGAGNVIIYELTETDKGCLRATISDMEGFSTNVFIVDNMEKAKEELQDKIMVIALESAHLKLYNGCVVLIADWHVLGHGPSPRDLGHVRVLPESFYRSLRKGTGSLTPSGMKRKKW